MSFMNDLISELKERFNATEKKEPKVVFPESFPAVFNQENIEIDYDDVIPEDERIQMCRKVTLDREKYQDFTSELYPYSLNFYDFEIFRYDWVVTIINPVDLNMVVIVNDTKALKSYYRKHRNEIWLGYNSRSYDTFILKSILLGMNPKKVSDDIILRGIKGWQISKDFRQIKLLDFDVYTKDSLKTKEGFMGSDIRETEVDFNINRKLNPSEVRQTIRYNIHDVEQTIEVFRRNNVEYFSQIALCEIFDVDIENVSKTQAQLASEILEPVKEERDDTWDISIPKTLMLDKYQNVADWFLDEKNHNEKSSLKINVCGVPHIFAWGGVHGAIEKYNYTCKEDEIMIMADVTQLYPSLMDKYHIMSRGCDRRGYEKLRFTIDTSIRLKKEGKKKEREPYKRFNNIIYGAMGDVYNDLSDPRNRNLVCVYGQLLILDLIEKIEPYIEELIQSNTDGILILIKKAEYERIQRIVHRWEKRAMLSMTFDEYVTVYQGDVNNYIVIDKNGKFKSKGAYVMGLDDLSYDLPIVNKAIVNYLTKGIYPEDTVNKCNDLKEFQKIVKISSAYKCGYHNGKYLNDRTFRVFASKDSKDSSLMKCKYPLGTLIDDRVYKGEKFANTPEHCFIHNDNVNGVAVTEKLDKSWYIDLAEKRLNDKFNINLNDDGLF